MIEELDTSLTAMVAVGFVAWGVASLRSARHSVTAPMVFAAAGIALSLGPDPVLSLVLDSGPALAVTEITLALVLFADAAGVRVRRLREDAALPSQLLLIGLPLTMVVGTLAAYVLLPVSSWWVAAVVGVAVSPTDAALGTAIVEDERVPERVRQLLNVESGLNDGIATPFVSFFLTAAVVGFTLDRSTIIDAFGELGWGVVIGLCVGAAAGLGLTWGLRHRWTDPEFVPIAVGASAVASYTLAVSSGVNGFVAAFVGGLAFSASRRTPLEHDSVELTRDGGQALSLVVWFLFGALVTGPLADAGWREALFALVALTVVRMLPVSVALARSGMDRRSVSVVAWFGPRGMASVVFGLLALEGLAPRDATPVITAIGVTVLASVVAHGVSAAPIAARFGTEDQTDLHS